MKLLVDLGFNRALDYPKPSAFRVNGIDTPEVRPTRRSIPDDALRALHKKAGLIVRDWLRARLTDVDLLIKTHKVKSSEKYGRYLAALYIDGVSLGDQMIEMGYANSYDGGAKPEWTEAMLQAIVDSVG